MRLFTAPTSLAALALLVHPAFPPGAAGEAPPAATCSAADDVVVDVACLTVHDAATVTDLNDAAAVQIDASLPPGQSSIRVDGPVRVGSVRIAPLTTPMESIAALRCDGDVWGDGGLSYLTPGGEYCECRRGLWMNAVAAGRPCSVDAASDDPIFGLVSDDVPAVTHFPGGPSAAVLDKVPTATEALLDECSAENAHGAFVRHLDECLFLGSEPVTGYDAKWQCLAAGSSGLDTTTTAGKDAQTSLRAISEIYTSDCVASSTYIGAALSYDRFSSASGGADRCNVPLGALVCSFPSFGPRNFTPLPRASANAARIVLLAQDGASGFLSADSGATFNALANAPDLSGGDDTGSVLVTSDRIIALGDDTVIVSLDDFATAGAPIVDGDFNDIATGAFSVSDVDPLNPRTMVMARDDTSNNPRVRVSSNGGISWRRGTVDVDRFHNDIVVRGTTIVVAMNAGRYFLSTDFGRTFQVTQFANDDPVGFTNNDNLEMICANDSGDSMLIGQDTGAIAQSTNRAVSWTAVTSYATAFTASSSSGYATACDYAGDSGNVAVATTDGYIFHSDDDGLSWTDVSPASVSAITKLSMNAEGVGVACGPNFVLISADSGATWAPPTNAVTGFDTCGLW